MMQIVFQAVFFNGLEMDDVCWVIFEVPFFIFESVQIPKGAPRNTFLLVRLRHFNHFFFVFFLSQL